MKKLLTFVAGSAIAIASCSAANSQTNLDLDTAEGAHKAMRKVQCSLVDDKPVTYYWLGTAFSRRMGERDKVLFDVEGMNVRSCSTISDPKRGAGYHLVTREILLYKDAKTGEILNTWENPWTGEEVQVMHVENDPVNSKGYVNGRDGKPGKFAGAVIGDKWQMNFTIPLFYPNTLAGEYQKEIGGTYHATEMFNFLGDVGDLTDMSKDTADVQIGWARMSDWLPWMNMGGRDGIIYMHTAGRKMESWDDMPKAFKADIKKHYPEYVAPPPSGDPRKNMTSWEYYKQVKEGKIEVPKR